jgi:hypothetical protein
MISDASLREDWVVAAMRTLNRVRCSKRWIRKQLANGITITITDRSLRAPAPEIGALR